MNFQHENTLEKAGSAYLRSARHQPVAWMQWGDEAFARAVRENKPVLLDIGAVWCHWCHVMDRESYENVDTAAIINEYFVAIKVDRDERPDVDTRYQAAVAAISGQGGWPLTAFLTPAGVPFFGGTYFPPDDRYDRPGLRRVLLAMADSFHNRRPEVEETAGSILQAIEESETFSSYGGDLLQVFGSDLLQTQIRAAMEQFDGRNGGFGTQPKFPHSGVLDLLLDEAARGGPAAEAAGRIAQFTLTKMADGGIHDQIGGGFHRYSVDERWHVPHFEKMSYDNSELLRNYVHAWETLRDPRFLEVAVDVVRWMDEVLTDRERGGFYASQDADVALDDDGDYFTWTLEEARAVLSPERFEAAKMYFGLRPVGDMHHNPAKNVLRRMVDAAGLAQALGVDEAEAQARLAPALGALQAVRGNWVAPYVDQTVYAGWNGMCISAYLAFATGVGRFSGVGDPFAFALRSLDRVLVEAWDPQVGLAHVVAYSDGAPVSQRVPGVLDDYAFVITAALDAWEASGEVRYFNTAQEMTEAMLARFSDAAGGGFFDTERAASGQTVLGVLSARRKPIQDAPSPAGNSQAAAVLLRLFALTGKELYRTRARATLQAFGGVVEHLGLYAASFGLALRRLLEEPIQVCILGNAEGDDEAADALAREAATPFLVNKSVLRLRWHQLGTLPPVLAETLSHFSATGGSLALVCRGNTCLPPISDPQTLREALRLSATGAAQSNVAETTAAG